MPPSRPGNHRDEPRAPLSAARPTQAKDAMSRTFYVTTPIYYVNDRPHIGQMYDERGGRPRALSAAHGGRSPIRAGTDGTGEEEHRRRAKGVTKSRSPMRSSATTRICIPAGDLERDFIRTTSRATASQSSVCSVS